METRMEREKAPAKIHRNLVTDWSEFTVTCQHFATQTDGWKSRAFDFVIRNLKEVSHKKKLQNILPIKYIIMSK